MDCARTRRPRRSTRPPGERPGVAIGAAGAGQGLVVQQHQRHRRGFECIGEFDPRRTPACVIVKHANPCGVAEGASLLDAYRRRWPATSTSAFGGIVALNRTLDCRSRARHHRDIHRRSSSRRTRPRKPLQLSRRRRSCGCCWLAACRDPRAGGLTAKFVAGGLLVRVARQCSGRRHDTQGRHQSARRATANWRICPSPSASAKHVKSNTIVYAKHLAPSAIGAGQMSRVDSARIAARKAETRRRTLELPIPMTKGSVVASNAFFPLRRWVAGRYRRPVQRLSFSPAARCAATR